MSGYIKEYIRITLASIKTPQAFFEGIKGEGDGYLKPFAYMMVSNMVYTTGGYLGFFLLFASQGTGLSSTTGLIGFAGFLISLVLAPLFIIISAALMHLSVRLVGGKGKFNQTFKVMCYSLSPMNFAWVFMVPMTAVIASSNTILMLIAFAFMLPWFFSMLYILYIVIVGISVTSAMTRSRAFVAVLIQIFIFFVIYMSFIISLIFLIGFSSMPGTDYPAKPYGTIEPPREILRYSTTVYLGSTPHIDGIADGKDGWYEGERIQVNAGGKDYTITTKHDFENIYILMEWEGPPEWNDQMALYFEQDDGAADFNLNTGVVDNYYQGHRSYGPDSFRDAHYDSGYTVGEPQDGDLKSGYEDGVWRLEWKIPMSSGDRYDIDIDNYPTQVGFAITNDLDWAMGIWPPGADMYTPGTWGNMTFVDEKKKLI